MQDGIDIDQYNLPGSPIQLVRAKGILKNIDIEYMFNAFTTGGLDERKKVSPDIIVRTNFFFWMFAGS